MSQGLEFGFGFNYEDMASPLSGLQDRAITQQSLRAALSRWLQAESLPVLTALDHVRSRRIPLHITQHREIVLTATGRETIRIATFRQARCLCSAANNGGREIPWATAFDYCIPTLPGR